MNKGAEHSVNEIKDDRNTFSGLNVRKFFIFLRPGKFYWRLWSLLLMGYSLSYVAYQLSRDASHGERVLPLSYSALFYTLFLIGIAFIGSGLRDHLGGTGMLDQILLWPMEERKKMMTLYLRATWLPAILLLIGGFHASMVVTGGEAVLLLAALPYGLGAAFFLSILQWKGSFQSLDSGTVIGSATFRDEKRLMFATFILTLSPLIFDVVPYFMTLIAAVVLGIAGVVYEISLWHQLKLSGGVKHLASQKKQENTETLSKIQGVRNPLKRYFYYLEWDEIKRPGVYYGIMISAVCFIAMIYYILGGYYFPSSEPTVMDRSIFLGFLIAYGTFFIYHITIMMMETNEIEIVLPISSSTKSAAESIHRFLRPTVYLILNGVLVSALIGFVHIILMRFISLSEISYGSLVINTVSYVLLLIPSIFAFYSSMDLLLKGTTVILQGSGFREAHKWLLFVFFIVYLMPLIISLIFFSENPSVLSVLWEPPVLFMATGVFILSRWGVYWTSKRIQVI